MIQDCGEMREYRGAEVMNIGIVSVSILVLIVSGGAFIYQRYKRWSRSAGPTERMEEMVELTSHQTPEK